MKSVARADEILPALPRSSADLDEIRRECRKLVVRRAGISAGASALPIPGLDIATDVAVLMELIESINRRFGLTPAQIETLDPRLQQLLLLAITRSGNLMVGKLVTTQLVGAALRGVGIRIAGKSAARLVPAVGTAASALIGFSTLRWLGNRHIDACVRIVAETLDAAPPEPHRRS